MSTKRIARTLVEGGRASSNKYDRRQTHRTRRSRERRAAYLALFEDPDWVDWGEDVPVYPEYADKTSAYRRWLGSFVGQSWNTARSAIVRGLDQRNIKDWHLRQHIDGDVALHPEDWFYNYRHFRVEEGLLQRTPPLFVKTKQEKEKGVSSRHLFAWVRGRRVQRRGDVLFWMESVSNSGASFGRRLRRDRQNNGGRPQGPFRQHDPLHKRDLKIWNTLSWAQQLFLLDLTSDFEPLIWK